MQMMKKRDDRESTKSSWREDTPNKGFQANENKIMPIWEEVSSARMTM
jgi:hypothetical protein